MTKESIRANRRELLLGGAAAAAIAIPALTGKALDAAPIDPVRGLVEKFKTYVDRLNSYPGDIPNNDPIWDAVTEIEDRISQSRATSADGVLAQLEYATLADAELRGESFLDVALFENMQATLRVPA